MSDDLKQYVDRIVTAIEGTTPHLTDEQRDVVRDHEELALQFVAPSATTVRNPYWVEGRPRVDAVPERAEAGSSITVTGRRLDLIQEAVVNRRPARSTVISATAVNVDVPDEPGGAELLLVSESGRILGPFLIEIVARRDGSDSPNPREMTLE
jgi:hypothetical protein